MSFEQLAGCKNGSCPKIFRQGARVAVQGAVVTERGQIDADLTRADVEIPLSVLVEAVPELANRVGDPGCSPTERHVWRRGDSVLVRGAVGTDFTRQIQPGDGEAVVELPILALVEAIRELVPA